MDKKSIFTRPQIAEEQIKYIKQLIEINPTWHRPGYLMSYAVAGIGMAVMENPRISPVAIY